VVVLVIKDFQAKNKSLGTRGSEAAPEALPKIASPLAREENAKFS